MNSITIVRASDDHFYLHCGEDVAYAMNFDELLGEVARWASGQPMRYLRSVDAIVCRFERRGTSKKAPPLRQHNDSPTSAPLRAQDIIDRLCLLQEEVFRHLGDVNAADCFCGKGGFWRSDSYGGTFEQGYRNDGKALAFIENAVRAAIAEGRRR